MSFAKAFGFSILAFIGLNTIFFLMANLVMGSLGFYFQALALQPLLIFQMLLGPIIAAQFPLQMTSTFTGWVMGVPIIPGSLILFIGYIVASILAAFLSGRFGENKIQAFMGWFATTMIVAIIVAIGGAIELVMLGFPSLIAAQVIGAISIGLTYGLACGSIALLTTSEF